ncbi:aldehyde dehydrogenase family protein [Enterobacter sp. 22466]|uniref:aldehyde dehydrogenase family protein n=1 Tax=Enterobacter sp. 22466 TaxID=3453924 RepID=UPI003F842572
MKYAMPNTEGAKINFAEKYDNFIGGEWCRPTAGMYMDNISPVDGNVFCSVADSDDDDINLALDAAHAAFPEWSQTSIQERSQLLLNIANRIEQNTEMLAVAETWDNGKPIRECLAADIPLMVDHFRYFAGCLRAEEGCAVMLDTQTQVLHLKEAIGVVGQIIPWNFPLLMAAWKLAPALAAGCCVVLKPAEQTPASVMVLMSLIADLLPPGIVNVVNGTGMKAGIALATSSRIAKIAFTGSSEVGRKILHNAANLLIPSTVELGGKSPNIYFSDILQQESSYVDKCAEGMLMGYFNQGEVCTCPSRALIEKSIFDPFITHVILRGQALKQGSPLDTDTQIGAQVSREQFDKILNYIYLGKKEGASLLMGGHWAEVDEYPDGYYIQPTLLQGNNNMRIFQEEIFGPVLGVTPFEGLKQALEIANDTVYGLGAGVWSRNAQTIHRMSQGIQAGRIWVNCYHVYPAHAAFGGYKLSGVGRETHKMAIANYQQTKSIISSFTSEPQGFF